MYTYRRTISKPIYDTGVGIHSGLTSTLNLFPAASGTGIVFRDATTQQLYALHARYIEMTDFCTILRFSPTFCMRTVEHLLAACFGLGISDLIIEVSSEELPFFDGSAVHFINLLKRAGIRELIEEAEYLVLKDSVHIEEETSTLILTPGEPKVQVEVRLSDAVHQKAHFHMLKDDFCEDIAYARTFAKLSNLESMRSRGLIKGGDLTCAIVLREDGSILNAEGFRLNNECARHKILDIMGDLMVLGVPCLASIYATAPGHSRTLRAVQHIAQHPELTCRMSYSQAIKHIGCVPAKKVARYAY